MPRRPVIPPHSKATERPRRNTSSNTRHLSSIRGRAGHMAARCRPLATPPRHYCRSAGGQRILQGWEAVAALSVSEIGAEVELVPASLLLPPSIDQA